MAIKPDELAQRLTRQLAAIPGDEQQLLRALPALPDPGLAGLAPAAVWLLVELHRQLYRQRWLGRVVTGQLGGDLAAIGEHGSLAHPEPADGRVPGEADWSFYFHGRGCCLTHDDGTTLDVDFVDGGSDVVDPYFFLHYLDSVADPGLPAQRLQRPAPTREFWLPWVDQLQRARLCQADHGLKLTAWGEATAEALELVVHVMERPGEPVARAYLAALLNDWQLAARSLQRLAPSAALDQLKRRRHTQAEILARGLHARLNRPAEDDSPHQLLQALAALGREHCDDSVRSTLRAARAEPVTGAAVDLAAAWRDADMAPLLLDLAHALPGAQIPGCTFRVGACRAVLLAYKPADLPADERQLLLTALANEAGACEGEAGLLLALLDRDAGLARLAAALHHQIPAARHEAAAALDLLGLSTGLPTGWSLQALRERYGELLEQWADNRRRP